MRYLRNLGLVLVGIGSMFVGVKDGIIARHLDLPRRYPTLEGADAARHGVVMVIVGLAAIAWGAYSLWKEHEEHR